MKSLVQFIHEHEISLKMNILEAQTQPTINWMKEHYEKYNKELFNNELPKNIRLSLIKNAKETALGWQGFERDFWYSKDYMDGRMYQMLIPTRDTIYNVKRGGCVPVLSTMKVVKDINEMRPYIELNPRYEFSEFQMEDTMIHEMVHLWVSRNCLQPKRAHGVEFKRKCDEVRVKAKKLYGKDYDLVIYANKHDGEEDKGFELSKSITDEIKADILQSAKRGGGVYSIYWIYDKDSLRRTKHPNLTHRFMFCTKNRLNIILKEIQSRPAGKLKEIWISPTAYIKMCEKHGKFATQNTLKRFWDTNQGFYNDKFLLENAKNILAVNEGLGSKIKEWIKKLMGAFVRITKGTPSSEIDFEDMLDYAEKVDDNQEIEGSAENEDKAQSID